MDEGSVNIAIRIGAWNDDLQAYPVEAALSDGGSYTGGRLILDREALRAVWLDPVAYGSLLTNALLTGPIRRAYDLAAAQADAKSEGRLRVRLRIDPAAAELHALLWERLRHQHRGRDVPLTTSAYTFFSRYVGLEAADVAPLAERPVRLLIAIANPADLPPSFSAVDVTQEIEGLAAALGDLRQQQQLEVTVLPGRSGLPAALRERLVEDGFRVADGPTSLDNLRRLLLEHHALHIISHGSFQRGSAHGPGTAALHLEGDDGTWQAVTDDRLVPALAAAGVLPHLIFLVACDSATRDDDTVHPFVGLGPKLVEAGVPAVVAMQDQVTARAARQLASDFWRDLLAHGEVDRALNAGRLLLVDDEGTDWSTPVLFMRLRDGRLFEPQPSPVTTSTPVPASLSLAQQREARGQDATDVSGGRSLRTIWTNLPGIAKSVIGVLTVLIPLATAWVQAGLPPFGPGPTPTVAASTLAATLMDVHLGARNVPLRQVYQERPQLDPAQDGISPEELDQLGQLVSYRIEFQGLLDRRCEVKWTLYDAATGERVPDGTWKTNHAVGWPDGFWTVEARERDVGQGEVWVPHVSPGRFVVELEVYDDRSILLDTERPMDAGGQPESFEVG